MKFNLSNYGELHCEECNIEHLVKKADGNKEFTNLYKIVCAWCKKDMGYKKAKEKSKRDEVLISHTVCEECSEKMTQELNNLEEGN